MLSIVIPTKDRRETVLRTVASLARQSPPQGGFEIIVVDDGSSDRSAEVLGAASAGLGAPMSVLEGPGRGPGSARNLGVETAAGDTILFLGDDTAPEDGRLLCRHAELHRDRSDERYAVLGRIEWDPRQPPTPFMQWLSTGGPQFHYHLLSSGPVSASDHFYSSHVSVRRSMLERAGGFDERFPMAAVEDTELGTRLADMGLALHYHPEAVVLHDHPTSVESSLRRLERVGQSARLYNAIRPERPHPHLKAPHGLRWLALQALSAPLEALALRDRPDLLRKEVWRLAHLASYRRGYVREPALAATARLLPTRPRLPS